MKSVFLDLDKAEYVKEAGPGVIEIPVSNERGMPMKSEAYFFAYFNAMYGEYYYKKPKNYPKPSLIEPTFLDVSIVEMIVSGIIGGLAYDIFKEAVLMPFLEDKKVKKKFKKVTKKKISTVSTDRYKRIYEYFEETYEPIEGADENLPPHKRIRKKVTTTKIDKKASPKEK